MAEERSRRQREEKLFSELDTARRELESLKSVTAKISENGWDVDTLIKHSPRQESENPQILQMRQELQKLREEQKEKDKLRQDLELKMERKEQLSEIKQYLNSNKEDYEFIQLHNYAHKVQELIDHYYQNEKKILSYSEAARAIENELEKHERQKTQAIAQTKKGKQYVQEYFTEIKSSSAPVDTKKTKIKEETTTTAEVSISKPKPIIPIAKKPSIKLQPVANTVNTESSAAFQNPSNKGKSKAEVMARVLAQYGG